MDKKIDKSIRLFISEAAKLNPGLISVYIFGSYSRNKQIPDSDIDIALILKDFEESDRFDLQVKLILLASKFDTRIEPHPLSVQDFTSNNPFAREIKKTGIEIAVNP